MGRPETPEEKNIKNFAKVVDALLTPLYKQHIEALPAGRTEQKK